MIAHVRIPRFFARTLRRDRGFSGTPVAVVDEGRVIDATPEAVEAGIEPGNFLETTDFPESVESLSFELECFVEAQERFYSRVKERFPITENFRFGEVFCEVETTRDFEELMESKNWNLPSRAGALTPSGWLSRILSYRSLTGTYQIITPQEYGSTLLTVEQDEIWGLGRDFTSRLRESEVDSFAELKQLDEPSRRKLFGTTSRALNRIFEGSDPKPLNPFSRARSISRDLDLSNQESLTRSDLRKKLEKTIRRFRKQLERSKCLVHRLELSLTTEDRRTTRTSHTFTSPTDEVEPLTIGVNNLISNQTVDANVISAELTAKNLVANTTTYHREAQENLENFEVL